MQRVKSLVLTAVLIAVGIVLPMAFHAIPKGGNIFLPMHIPVLLCGFLCGPVLGTFAGVITPALSSFATGMPPMTILPAMAAELAVYGFATGILIRLIRTKYQPLNLYLALIVAMLCGRAVSGVVNGLILSVGKYSVQMWLTASFVLSWPGILIQLLLIPQLLFALEKAGIFVPDRRDLWGVGSLKNVRVCKSYFNAAAADWDSKGGVSPERLKQLVALSGVRAGERVLDVGCGTGVIDPVLLELGAAEVVAVDVADEMIAVARSKRKNPRVTYMALDFYGFHGREFDRVVVYNAFPHFMDRNAFAAKVAACLKEGGTFAVIHSASAAEINARHTGVKRISRRLRPATEEAVAFRPFFEIEELADNENYYLIRGVRKSNPDRR